jgi:hypothetical protein
MFGAKPQSTDETPKPTIANKNVRRKPSRASTAASAGNALALAIKYEVSTQAACSRVADKLPCNTGKATFATVMSMA